MILFFQKIMAHQLFQVFKFSKFCLNFKCHAFSPVAGTGRRNVRGRDDPEEAAHAGIHPCPHERGIRARFGTEPRRFGQQSRRTLRDGASKQPRCLSFEARKTADQVSRATLMHKAIDNFNIKQTWNSRQVSGQYILSLINMKTFLCRTSLYFPEISSNHHLYIVQKRNGTWKNKEIINIRTHA